jgi:ADP-ribose pyrophosphatase YjhB (NUDIX family)
MQEVTITFLVTPSRVCLAPKLEGWGVGYLSGYGGRLKAHELPVNAAIREVEEKSTVILQPNDLVLITTMDFFKEGEHLYKTHIFLATRWEGEPRATKEMGKPSFFLRKDPPIKEMWRGDVRWFPDIIRGARIPDGGYLRYDSEMKEVVEFFLPPRI